MSRLLTGFVTILVAGFSSNPRGTVDDTAAKERYFGSGPGKEGGFGGEASRVTPRSQFSSMSDSGVLELIL